MSPARCSCWRSAPCICCRGRHVELAKRSMTVAASFGLASALSVVVLGDESGYTAGENQKMKIAAIEAMWETEPAPASFTLFGLPDQRDRTHRLCRPRAVDAGPDRHAFARPEGARHQGTGRRMPRSASAAASIAYDALQKTARGSRDECRSSGQRLRRARRRSRLCAAAEDATPRHRQRDAGADRRRPPGTRCRRCRRCSGASASWSASASSSSRCSPYAFCARHRRQADSSIRAFSLDRAMRLPLPWIAAELGWYRRRGRPPALGDRRRAADFLAVSEHLGGQRADHAHRLHRVLLGACRRRDVADGSRPSRLGPPMEPDPPHRPCLRRSRNRRPPNEQGARPCSTTKLCASSGGRCSASC